MSASSHSLPLQGRFHPPSGQLNVTLFFKQYVLDDDTPLPVLDLSSCRTVRKTVTENLTVFGLSERFHETKADSKETGWHRNAIHLMIKTLKDDLQDYGFGDVLLSDSRNG